MWIKYFDLQKSTHLKLTEFFNGQNGLNIGHFVELHESLSYYESPDLKSKIML